MRRRNTAADAAILEFASAQCGVVARRQLLGAGVTPGVIERRIRSGWLHPLYSGVYQAGPVAAAGGREIAAVLACGMGSLISHRTAGTRWRVLSAHVGPPDVELIVPSCRSARRRGVHAYHIDTVRADERTKHEGIPITTPARTLFDLASLLRARELERAYAEALALRLTTRVAVEKLLTHHMRERGSTALRALIATEPALTRSEAEERFLRLVRKVRLPEPETNVRVCGTEVDFVWRRERLVVEVDGHAFHTSAQKFESDRRRDGLLVANGYRVVRVTWKQLSAESEVVAVIVAQALANAP